MKEIEQSFNKSKKSKNKRRRDTPCKGLNDIGWKVPYTDSTMFTWFPIPPNYTSSEKFTFDLLEMAGVLCVPGVSFGKEGEGYVRMALVQSVENLEKAIENIKNSGILEK